MTTIKIGDKVKFKLKQEKGGIEEGTVKKMYRPPDQRFCLVICREGFTTDPENELVLFEDEIIKE